MSKCDLPAEAKYHYHELKKLLGDYKLKWPMPTLSHI
jgi:hypothetical protein